MSSSQEKIPPTMEVSHPQASVTQTPTPSLPPPKSSLSVSSPSPSSSSSSSTSSKPKPSLLLPHPIAKTGSALVPVLDVSSDQNNNDNNKNIIDVSYFDSFPPGYRFCPYDEELVVHYLKKKVNNQSLPRNRIVEVNLYRYNPEKLAEAYRHCGEKEWYFFTPREKKYRNGSRPNRAAGDGYWKATGADKPVKDKGAVVGYRKALVFYRGKPPKGDKTNWIMHEYRVNDAPPRSKTSPGDMRLDDWVLCRIYKKAEKPNSRARHREEESVQSHPRDHNDTADHLDVGGMDVDMDSDSTGYTFSDLVLTYPISDESTSFSQIPPFENNIPINNYGHDHQAMAAATCYPFGPFAMGGIQEPACVKPLQTHSRENIFTSRYLNENSHSLGLRQRMPQDEWVLKYSNYVQPNIAPQLDMVNLENIMPINRKNNPASINSSNSHMVSLGNIMPINRKNNPAIISSSNSDMDSNCNVDGKWH